MQPISTGLMLLKDSGGGGDLGTSKVANYFSLNVCVIVKVIDIFPTGLCSFGCGQGAIVDFSFHTILAVVLLYWITTNTFNPISKITSRYYGINNISKQKASNSFLEKLVQKQENAFYPI